MGSHGNQETSVSRQRERWTTGFKDAEQPRKRRLDLAAQKSKVTWIITIPGGVETGAGVSGAKSVGGVIFMFCKSHSLKFVIL